MYLYVLKIQLTRFHILGFYTSNYFNDGETRGRIKTSGVLEVFAKGKNPDNGTNTLLISWLHREIHLQTVNLETEDAFLCHSEAQRQTLLSEENKNIPLSSRNVQLSGDWV